MTDTTTGPTELEQRVLTEVFHGANLIEARAGVATFADLVERIGQHHPAPSPASASPLRQAVQACLRKAWLRAEPADEKTALTALNPQWNPLGYVPTGRDRLVITDAGVRQLPNTQDRLIERNALTAAGNALHDAQTWIFTNMVPYTPTPPNQGVRYDALAETNARALVAAARAAVAQGDYWTRHAFMNAVAEHFDAIVSGDRA
jgi:hypothetical protein